MSDDNCPKCGTNSWVRTINQYWTCRGCGEPMSIEESHKMEAERLASMVVRDQVEPLRRQLAGANAAALVQWQEFDRVVRELAEAKAACAALRELVRGAYADGQRTAGTDLTSPGIWEKLDSFDALQECLIGQPILDRVAKLERAIEAIANGELDVDLADDGSNPGKWEYLMTGQNWYGPFDSEVEAVLAGVAELEKESHNGE